MSDADGKRPGHGAAPPPAALSPAADAADSVSAPATAAGALGAFTGSTPAVSAQALWGPTEPVMSVVPSEQRSASPPTRDGPSATDPPLEPTGQIVVRPSLLSVDWLSDPGAWAAGSVIGGRYLLLRALGHGGMGDVLLAEDLFLRRKVAIKTLRTNMVRDPSAMEAFRQEVAMAHAVAHPGLARTYDLGEAQGITFLTMEYLEGESLWDRIQRVGPLPVDEVRQIGVQVAQALHAAHRAGIVHRDMKPSNIQLTPNRGAVVLDFGLAAGIDRGGAGRAADPGRSELVRPSSSTAGTPQYMPPEQWKGEAQGVATDIYAFGAILFEALTARPPFDKRDEVELMMAHVGEAPPALRSLRPEVSPALDRLVALCLSKEPGRRPPAMDTIAASLQPPSVGRHVVTAALALGVAALFLLAGWVAWQSAHALVVREMGPSARRLAELTALQISAPDLDRIRTPDDMRRPEFERTLTLLRRLKRDNPEVRFMYTLRVGDEPHLFEFVVDADPLDVDRNGDGTIQDEESGSPPGLEYDGSDFPELITAARERRATADRRFAADLWGISLSGYAPVARPVGEGAGDTYIVGVDLGNDPVQRLREVLQAIFALLGLVSAGLVIALRRRARSASAGHGVQGAGARAAVAAAAALLACSCWLPGAMAQEAPSAAERLADSYSPALRVSHVVPAVMSPSSRFVVHGAGFGEVPGRLDLAGKACTVERWGETAIVARAPYRGLRGPVAVRAAGQQALSPLDVVVAEPSRVELPTVTALTPAQSPDPLLLGTTATIAGEGLGDVEGYVFFTDPLACALAGSEAPAHCSTPAAVQSWSDGEIVVDVPLSCRGEVTVTVLLGHLALSAPVRYQCPPVSP